MINWIVVMGGSFNPPTIAHLQMLQTAVKTLNAEKGIFVPAPHTYVMRKMSRAKHPDEVFSESLRLQMLRQMTEGTDLLVDDLEYHRMTEGYTYDTMLDLKTKYPDGVLCFLVGADKLESIPRWYGIRKFLEQFHIAVMKRDGENPETIMEQNPFFIQYRDRFHIIQSPEGMEGISSSAIRENLRHKKEDVKWMCHPKVWELLQQEIS